MKHWFLNLRNNYNHDPRVHMTFSEIKKNSDEKKPLPKHVIVHSDSGQKNKWMTHICVSFDDICAPKTVFEFDNIDVEANNLIAEKVIVDTSRWRTSARFLDSRIEEIGMKGPGFLGIYNVACLSEVTFDNISMLEIEDAMDLFALNTSDIYPLQIASLKNVPNLESSKTLNVLRVNYEDGEQIYIHNDTFYLSDDMRGTAQDLLEEKEYYAETETDFCQEKAKSNLVALQKALKLS